MIKFLTTLGILSGCFLFGAPKLANALGYDLVLSPLKISPSAPAVSVELQKGSSHPASHSSAADAWEELDTPNNNARIYRICVKNKDGDIVGYLAAIMSSGGEAPSLQYVPSSWTNARVKK